MSNYVTKTFQKKLYVDTKSMAYLKKFSTIFETTKIADFQMKKSPNFFFFKKTLILISFRTTTNPSLNFCPAITVQHLLLRPMIAGHQKN